MYGIIHDYVGEAVLAAKLPANAHRLFLWAIWHSKAGNRLSGYELETLRGWIEENAPETPLKGVQTVQYSQRKAAEVFNGNKTEVDRQTKRLVQAGILAPIGNASRWHAQLFVICPIAHTSRCDREDATVADTSKCDREDATVADTFESRSGHILGLSRTHPDAVNCGDAAYSLRNINTTSAYGAAKEEAAHPLSCPACGSSDSVRVTEGGLATCSCGTAWGAEELIDTIDTRRRHKNEDDENAIEANTAEGQLHSA